MAKAQNKNATATMKQRFNRQKRKLASSGKSTEEIGQMAMKRATKHHAANTAARKGRDAQRRQARKASTNANTRAFGSLDAGGVKTTKVNVQAVGRRVRGDRTRAGQDLSTGAKQSALKTGRKALKQSARRGTVGRQAFKESMRALIAMDPTTRRAFMAGIGDASASRRTSFKGGFKNVAGQSISATLSKSQDKKTNKAKKAAAKRGS